MPIRDILLTIGILSTLPVCLFRPWIGVLMWSWLAFMNPHRLTWGFAQDVPFSQFVGAVTLVGFVFSRERKAFVISRELLVIGVLWLWFIATTVNAMYPEAAWEAFMRFSKVLVMALLVVPLFQDQRRLRILVFVMAASLGFYGIKGGLFVLGTGGQYMVLGPPSSFFAANTELALALNMAIPLLLYLAREESRRWLRLSLWSGFFLTMLAVPFTYSRGGVVGLVVVLIVLFVKARRRILVAGVMAAGLAAFILFVPEQWVSRMQTLEEFQSDESANLRLMSWRVATDIVRDHPVLGGGFSVFVHRATYDIYLPEYPREFGHDAHSIYFNLLGEHGWVGLGLFITLIASVFMKLYRVRRLAMMHQEVKWAGNYAHMIQASLATYLVNGAFLSVAYFDLAYQLMILVPVIEAVAIAQVGKRGGEPVVAPVPVTVAPGRSA